MGCTFQHGPGPHAGPVTEYRVELVATGERFTVGLCQMHDVLQYARPAEPPPPVPRPSRPTAGLAQYLDLSGEG